MPAAFGRDIKGDGKNFWIGTTENPGKTVSQSGIFDRFLCQTHEDAIHDYEDYAIDFIRGFKLTDAEVSACAFRRDGTDNEALIRFVCSVLWRFHHSDREEAAGIDLGEWEPNMRHITFGGSVNQAPDVFMCAIHQTVMPNDAFMLTPATGMQWGRRALQFSANGLIFNTKMDHEVWPSAIQGAVLNQTPNWLVSGVFHWGNKEWQCLRAAIGQMQTPRTR
jgi:hypothetical protein